MSSVPTNLGCHFIDHMVRLLTATEAKATLLALLDDVAGGEQIEITKHGHVVAHLVQAVGAASIKYRLTVVARSACGKDQLLSTGETWNAS